MFSPSMFVFSVCLKMCFFDGKCKSLNRLGENIKQTENNNITTHKQKYRISSPRTSANKYNIFIRGRVLGWISCISVFISFRSFSVLLLFLLLFSPSLFKLLHLQSKQHIYKQKQKTRRKHLKKHTKHKYIISQPEPERYVFAVGSWAGYPVFLCLCISRSFSLFSFYVFYCFMFVVCFLLFMFVSSAFA